MFYTDRQEEKMMFSWNNPMVKGVLIGVGASLVGFAVYKHN